MLVAYSGQEQLPAWKPTTKHERKWEHIIEPASRAQQAMDNLNRQGLDAFRQRGMPESVREIVQQVAKKRRVSIALMASASRLRIAFQARGEAMYLTQARNPGKPLVAYLARWFDRDHTCVYYGIAAHQERHNLPKLVGYDIAKRRARLRALS